MLWGQQTGAYKVYHTTQLGHTTLSCISCCPAQAAIADGRIDTPKGPMSLTADVPLSYKNSTKRTASTQSGPTARASLNAGCMYNRTTQPQKPQSHSPYPQGRQQLTYT